MEGMSPIEYWKNWRMGTELRVSGNFIYNGLYTFDQLEHFYYEEEVFEFLYFISIGIERLQKIMLVIYEEIDVDNLNEFEKSLITHSHADLMNRINKIYPLGLNSNQNKFINLLTKFYKTMRYDRFGISSIHSENQEKAGLIDFISGCMNLQITAELINPSINNFKIKEFIGKTILGIVRKIHGCIELKCSELNIYTTELEYRSKSWKIFLSQDFTFQKERMAKKEIILNLLLSNNSKQLSKKINKLKPLKLDYYNYNFYLKYLVDPYKLRDLTIHIDELHEEQQNIKLRNEYLELLASDYNFEDHNKGE